jgi:hypothetical protein
MMWSMIVFPPPAILGLDENSITNPKQKISI